MKKARVKILASSSLFAAALAKDFVASQSAELTGSVFSVNEALGAIQLGQVDVLLVDAQLPGMNIRGLVQRINATPSPCATIVVCPALDRNIMAYRAVAADVVTLPERESPLMRQTFFRNLDFRIKIAAGSSTASRRTGVGKSYKWRPGMPFSTRFTGIVAIGASAGGTEATQEVLRNLPHNFPGMVITQHMPPMFTKTYADRLNTLCRIEVAEAADFDEVRPGKALIAPGGMQMRVQKAGSQYPIVRCRGDEKVSGHCPSVDALFDSIALNVGSRAIGVILTGMGGDGADGLLAMRRKGCFTIGQDEATSLVYGMPNVAFVKGAVKLQLPLGEIAQALCSHLMEI